MPNRAAEQNLENNNQGQVVFIGQNHGPVFEQQAPNGRQVNDNSNNSNGVPQRMPNPPRIVVESSEKTHADRKETLEEGVYCWVDEARLLLMDVFRRRQAFTYETKQLERFRLKGGEKKALAEEVCRLSVCLSYWLLWN